MSLFSFLHETKITKEKMNLKYLLLFVCFIQMLNYCYGDDDLSLSNKGSFLKMNIIPKCRYNVETVGFLLFTRENRHGVSLTLKNLTSNNAFKGSQPTRQIVFLIHGFVSSENDQHFLDMAQALLNKDHLFVISINWKEAACTNEPTLLQYAAYPKAVANTRLVGKYVADFTKILVEEYKVPMKNIRLIGHSLGAQVAGFAGKEIQKSISKKYPEIIGLDPAGPLFRLNTCSKRICETDADYVQIIHTSNILGTEKALGTVDFYMNKGRHQPGCNIFDASCSHAKAVGYLTECIKRECCLIGIPWDKSTQPLSTCTKDTCVCVGLNAKKYPATGSFYVPVEVNPPYCNNNGSIL